MAFAARQSQASFDQRAALNGALGLIGLRIERPNGEYCLGDLLSGDVCVYLRMVAAEAENFYLVTSKGVITDANACERHGVPVQSVIVPQVMHETVLRIGNPLKVDFAKTAHWGEDKVWLGRIAEIIVVKRIGSLTEAEMNLPVGKDADIAFAFTARTNGLKLRA